MKCLAAFALAIFASVPAMAQFGGMGGMGGAQSPQNPSIEVQLLEMEQEADMAALKEALLLQAKQGIKSVPDSRAGKERDADETVRLRDFIAKKKEAITNRAAEIADKRTAGRRVPTRPPGRQPNSNEQATPRSNQSTDGGRQESVEDYERAKVEVQLLQAQINLLQKPMEEAIQALAKADLEASTDEAKRPAAQAARKDYEKIKEKLVEHNKRLYQQQLVILPMQQQRQRMGMLGFGGGFQ